ncbi:MAG: helicase-associated domain-containing protein [Moorellaceae bacterium]
MVNVRSYQDYLDKLPLESLQTLARNLKLTVPEREKVGRRQEQAIREKLYKELVAFYSQPSNLDKLWQELEPEARYMLELVLFSAGAEGTEAQKVHGKLYNLWGKEVTQQVRDRLLGLGLLFSTTKPLRQEMYHIPGELRGYLYYKKTSSLLEPLRQGEDPAENYGKFLWVDFYIFLGCVLQWGIKVAQAGHIYKKDRKKIAALLHYPEVEEWYEFLENLAWRQGFLEKDEVNYVYLSQEAWDWLQMPPVEQWYQFVSWILEKELARPQHLWMEHILNFVLSLPPGRWMSLSNLYRLISEFSSGAWRQYLLEKAKENVRQLVWTGLLELRGDWERGAVKGTSLLLLYLRLVYLRGESTEEAYSTGLPAEAGELFPEENSFVVQPNFEILAPLEIHPWLFMQMCSLAELVSADRVFVFRLSQQSLSRGFRQGWLPENMLKFFNDHTKYELPPNVRTTLEEWTQRMGKVYLERGVLVRCEAGIAEQIKAFLQEKGWLVDQISPTAFLIPENIAGVCLKCLERDGFFPRPQIIEHFLEARAIREGRYGEGESDELMEYIWKQLARKWIMEEFRKK